MQKLLVSVLALSAISSVAFAEPAKLSDNQMGQIAAGQSVSISQTSSSTSSATCTDCNGFALGVALGSRNGGNTAAAAGIEVSSSSTSFNIAHVTQVVRFGH